MESPSCLITKMSHYIPLDAAEKALIARLEKDEKSYAKGQVIRQQGDDVRDLFVVKRGWVSLSSSLEDGGRQIFDLHFPGDIVGTRDIVFKRATVTIVAANDVVLCPFPKQALDEIFEQSPRISALLFSFGVLENTSVFDRLRSVARMDAASRLGFFLLQIMSRLRITRPEQTDSFDLPLNQALIGDALGLSQVHVNRTFRELEVGGLIRRSGRSTITVDRERMMALTSFSERYYQIDTSWFPKPGSGRSDRSPVR